MYTPMEMSTEFFLRHKPRLDPPDPMTHVRPELGGALRRLPLLLIKPDGTCKESLHHLLAAVHIGQPFLFNYPQDAFN